MSKGNKQPLKDKAKKKPKKAKIQSQPSGSIYSRQGDSAVP